MDLTYQLKDFDVSYLPKWKDGYYNLDISFQQLIHAAYTVGRASYNDVYSDLYYSNNEVNFRINMINSFLREKNHRIEKTPIYERLDPSEKVAINYFFGMTFSKLVADKIFDVPWIMHLDVYTKGLYGNKKIKIDLKHGNSRPDFIGFNSLGEWLVLESKGRTVYKSATLTKAKEQAENLGKINGDEPFLRIGVLSHFINNSFNLKIIDPFESKEEALNLKIDQNILLKDYYSKIYLYLKDSEEIIVEVNKLRFKVRHNTCLGITFGLQKDIYDLLEKFVNDEKTSLVEETQEQIKIMRKRVVEVQELNLEFDNKEYVGKDGILIIEK